MQTSLVKLDTAADMCLKTESNQINKMPLFQANTFIGSLADDERCSSCPLSAAAAHPRRPHAEHNNSDCTLCARSVCIVHIVQNFQRRSIIPSSTKRYMSKGVAAGDSLCGLHADSVCVCVLWISHYWMLRALLLCRKVNRHVYLRAADLIA